MPHAGRLNKHEKGEKIKLKRNPSERHSVTGKDVQFIKLILRPLGRNHEGERYQGSIALVLDLVRAFERASLLPVVWAWATLFNFPRPLRTFSQGQRGAAPAYCVAVRTA